MKNDIRFTEIDLLRFLAAMAVMMMHFTLRGFVDGDHLSPVHFTAIGRAMKYNYLAVNFFFLISGFVILMTAQGKSAKEYIISRVVRLFPAYWACCTITFITLYFFGHGLLSTSIPRYIINIPMANQFFHVGAIEGVYWTLYLEWRFYFLVLLLILFNRLKQVHLFMGIWLCLSILLLRFHSGLLENIFIPRYSAYFISGAMFYLIYKEGISFYKIALIGCCFLFSVVNDTNILNEKSSLQHLIFSQTTLIIILLIFYMIFFAVSLNLTKFLRSDFLILLGALSYPIYLVHYSVGLVLFNYLSPHMNKYAMLVAIPCFIIFVCYLIHIYVEKGCSKGFKTLLMKINFFPRKIPASNN